MDWLLNDDEIYSINSSLTLENLLYAIHKKLITVEDARNYLVKQLDANTKDIIYDLIAYDDDYLFFDMLKKIIPSYEPSENDQILWIYIYLKWLFIHKNEFKAPYEQIDLIIWKFEYSEILLPLLPWTPLKEGEIGGEDYLFNNWVLAIKELETKLKLCSSPQNK